ncbi:hypothetical protein [Actibacterium sp. 188UL27-1]|nr:hypothetical protein [Actibacterium sp. 188UL27-1]MBM7069034.1 hypothetical protein [Actibacterium sp. 188UL27-1]
MADDPKLPSKLITILRDPQTMTYVLGVIGWLIVVWAFPFDWSLPAYAEF